MTLGIGDLEDRTFWYGGTILEIVRREEAPPRPHQPVWVSGATSRLHAQYLLQDEMPQWLRNHGIDVRGVSDHDAALVDGLVALMDAASRHGANQAKLTNLDFTPHHAGGWLVGVHAELYAAQSTPARRR